MDRTLKPGLESVLDRPNIFNFNTLNLYEIMEFLWSEQASTGVCKIRFDYKYRMEAITQALHHINNIGEIRADYPTHIASFQLDPLCIDPSEAVIYFQWKKIERTDFDTST